MNDNTRDALYISEEMKNSFDEFWRIVQQAHREDNRNIHSDMLVCTKKILRYFRCQTVHSHQL